MSQEPSEAGSPHKRSKWLGYAQLAIILLAIAVALYLARAPNREERVSTSDAAQSTPAVSVVTPNATQYVVTKTLTGTIRAEKRVTVRSQVPGRIVWVSSNFTEGGRIPANEPFVRIDPSEFEIAVEAARMAVNEAEAEVDLERAKAESSTRSFADSNPGKEVPEDLRRLPSIAVAEARLGKARAALALAELQLARTAISLPFDSRVVSSDVDVGEVVGTTASAGRSAKIGIIYRRGALQVRVPIDPGILANLEPVVGRAAVVNTQSGSFEAEVVGTSSVISPGTRLAAVFLKFTEGSEVDSLPAPGTFAYVDIVGPRRDNVYVLPESAAREHNKVWVVRSGALSMEAPKTVSLSEDGWVVEAFDAGEGVVVGPLPGAAQDLEVRIVSAASSN
jgi:RND family efflux transporter MFP subunit